MDELAAGRQEGYRTKVCPRCGAELYADMGVCYGCLYDFTREKERPEASGLPAGACAGGAGTTLDLARRDLSVTSEVGVTVSTPSVDLWVAVPPWGVLVGRGSGNDIVLHARAVSRSHLRLVPTPDGMEVHDLESTNPARYRGRDVRGTIVVPYGELIDVCGSLLAMTGPTGAPVARDPF